MKNLVLLLLLAFSICLFSCARNVVKNNTKTQVTETEITKATTNIQTDTELVTESTQLYGDSLKASLHFDEHNASDSIESAGLFVKGTLVKTSNGYKVNLKAVAKPVIKTDKTTQITQEKKQVLSLTDKTIDTTTTEKEKEVTPTLGGKIYTFITLGFLLLLLFIILRFVYKRFTS